MVARLTGVNYDETFTTDPKATPVHVASWGFLGDTWPYFRPNFVNMEAYREEQGVDEVRLALSANALRGPLLPSLCSLKIWISGIAGC